MYSDGPKSVIVDKMGPCELTAADIKVDDEIEIINPDMHIDEAQQSSGMFVPFF